MLHYYRSNIMMLWPTDIWEGLAWEQLSSNYPIPCSSLVDLMVLCLYCKNKEKQKTNWASKFMERKNTESISCIHWRVGQSQKAEFQDFENSSVLHRKIPNIKVNSSMFHICMSKFTRTIGQLLIYWRNNETLSKFQKIREFQLITFRTLEFRGKIWNLFLVW